MDRDGGVLVTFIKKEHGFSLLEVLVALGIVSFLSFTVLQLVFTNLQATKSVEMTASLDNLILEVNTALKDPAVCLSNLSNFSTTTLPSPLATGSINVSQITLPSATTPLARTNGSLANQPNTKLALSIGNIKPLTTTSYLANIAVSLDKGLGTIGARNIVRNIPMSLTLTTAGGPITGCNTFGPSSGGNPAASPSAPQVTIAQICAAFGTTVDSKTGQCAGGPLPTLSKVCASLGGTFNESTQACTGATTVASGGGSSAGPAPTPTPKLPCAAGSTICGGKSFPVPEIADQGQYNRDWADVISGINVRCQMHIYCVGGKWNQDVCNCLAQK